jgi:ABC-type transport system involved in multi-copper enzyme maturation permease subunit
MLWYKSWLETRWRFIIGLAILMLSAAGSVLAYPQVMKLLPAADTLPTTGEVGRRIREGVELSRNYHGYIWSQSFGQNLMQMATLFAVLLGSGGPFCHGSELYTLSMPASRHRLLGIRAAAGLAELFVIILISSLLIPLLSPAIGQTFGVGSTLVHGLCLFIASATFFSLAVLLSTSFSDMWRPLLIACAVAVVVALCGSVLRSLEPYSIFHLMSGETYFRTGQFPWLGLLMATAASAAMLYGAAINIARRDF